MRRLGVTRRASDRAVDAAYAAQREFQERLIEAGKQALATLDDTGEPGLVLVGRGYNIYDRSINCDIPRKLRHRYGANVIPLDFLVTGQRAARRACTPNMFWISGRKILEAARIARHAAEPAHDLHLELQVRAGLLHQALHARGRGRAAAGAAIRRARQRRRLHDALRSVPRQQRNSAMLPIGDGDIAPKRQASRRPSTKGQADLHSADGVRQRAGVRGGAFRAIGLDAEPTPPSDHRTRELGARYTSGDECYPAKVTVGDFMKVLEQPGDRPGARSRCSCRRPRARAGSDSTRRTCGRFWTPTGTPTSRSSRRPARTPTTGWATLAGAVRAHRLARAAGGRPAAEDAAACTGRTRSSAATADAAYEECLDDLCADARETRRRARRAAAGAARVHGALPRPFPQARSAARRDRCR